MFKEIVATYLFTKLLGKERAKKLSIFFQRYTVRSAAIVLGIIAIGHSIRLVLGTDISIAGWSVPVWFSFVISIVTGYLAFGLWKIK